MAVDTDAELTSLAAGILRNAVRTYDLALDLTPALFAPDMTMTSGFGVTGSFSAVTGSLPALTGALAVLTGSFAAVGTDAAEVSTVTLKGAFRLPGKLPGVRLPPEQELAAMARSAPVIGELAALASWLGRDGRLVTGTDDLAGDDAADACRQLGIGPERLSFLWQYALISGWFELGDSADGQRTWAVIGQTARRWADGDDSGALHGWSAVFAAVTARALGIMAGADLPGARRLHLDGPGVALVVMLFAARQSGMTSRDIEDLVRDRTIGDNPSFLRKRAWTGWVQEHGHPAHRLLGELAALRAVTMPQYDTGTVELAPLAMWAMRKQFLLDKISVPLLRPPSQRMTAADLVTLCEAVSEAEFEAAFAEWLAGRDPEQAVRELLIYAGSVDPQGRLTAVAIARRIGAPGYRAWKDAVKRPELRGYARVSLSMMAGDLPKSTLPLVLEPDPQDMAWLATDLLAMACGTDDPDPDEIATLFAEVVPDGQDQRVLGQMAQISHPDAGRVLEVLGTYHPNGRIAREARKAWRAMAARSRELRRPAMTGRR